VTEAPPSSKAALYRSALAAGTLVLGALIVSPLLRPRGWDSFPISSYPMFSRGDLGTVNALAHAVLVRADGSRGPATPSMVGTPEPMVAMSIIRSHIERGTASQLCESVAARAREARAEPSSGAGARETVSVEIVTSVFDTRRYFSAAPDARAPLRREVHARCEVP